jgi:CBS domain
MPLSISPSRFRKCESFDRADDQYGSTQCLQIDQSTFVREAGTLYRFDRCIGWRSIGPDGGDRGPKMTVKTILSNKGSNVTTTEPAATLECGMRILAEHGIGALVVVGADQRVIGVLSERDILIGP